MPVDRTRSPQNYIPAAKNPSRTTSYYVSILHRPGSQGDNSQRANGPAICDKQRVVTPCLVEHVKTETSKWAKKDREGNDLFQRQSGYGAFSVSHSMKDKVDEYIRSQEQHHATSSFQDEYRRLCEKHGIEIDERYVWD
jgi:hypothetical protein